MKSGLLLASCLAVVLVAVGASLRHATYQHDGTIALPDPSVTPGAMGTLTTAQLCSKGFRTASVRHVTESEKKAVCAEYGVIHCDGKHVEIDHLIDLWGNGSNRIENLWPQPIVQARRKDVLERRLHKLACAGTITFQQAAHEISTDWYAAYKKYVVVGK